MITVFKKIWSFAEKEQSNIQKSIIVGFLCAAFNAMQMGGVYYVLVKIFDETLSMKDIAIVLGILLVSLVGKIITQYISQLEQTHAGYFMAADKRIRIGNKLKRVPMGFFSEFSLGKITTMSTTTLSQIEMQVPMLLVLVLGGLLNTFVFALALFYLHIMVGITAFLGILAFFMVTYFMEKKSRENASEIGIAQTHLTKQVLETVQGMQVIKSYNLGGKNNKELSNAFEENCNITMKLEKTMTPYIALQRIVLGISIAAIIILSAKYYIEGDMLLADAIMSMIAGFIIFEGINDIGTTRASLTMAQRLIEAYKIMVKKCRKAHLRVWLATITPMKGSAYYSEEHEKCRQIVNEWIRTQQDADGYLDFDKLMRDPTNEQALHPQWKLSDNLHPNAVGYKEMGRYAADFFMKQ